VSWTCFVSVIFLFPTAQPVTVLNMNCIPDVSATDVDAVAVMAAVGLFAFIWWWAGARNYCMSVRWSSNGRYWTQGEYTCCGCDCHGWGYRVGGYLLARFNALTGFRLEKSQFSSSQIVCYCSCPLFGRGLDTCARCILKARHHFEAGTVCLQSDE
jgi:hypothetical protein